LLRETSSNLVNYADLVRGFISHPDEEGLERISAKRTELMKTGDP